MADLPPLSLADQAFLNIAASLCFWTPDRGDRAFSEELARELLPHANREHRYLAAIIGAVEDMASTDQARRFGAAPRLEGAVHAFLRWRGMMAMDAWQAKRSRDAA